MNYRKIDCIRVFEEIRDVPYRIPLTSDEPDQCCEGKYSMFMRLAERYSITARPRVSDSR